MYGKHIILCQICFFVYRRDTSTGQYEIRQNNTISAQTMPYSNPLPLLNSIQEDSVTLNSDKMINTDFPIPYVDFDDDNYLKSIITNIREEKQEVKMQLNPSYFKTDIPDNNYTEV